MKQHASRRGEKGHMRKVVKKNTEEEDLRIRKDERDLGRNRGDVNYQAPLTS